MKKDVPQFVLFTINHITVHVCLLFTCRSIFSGNGQQIIQRDILKDKLLKIRFLGFNVL